MAKAFVASGNAVNTELAAFAAANQALNPEYSNPHPSVGRETANEMPAKRAEMSDKTGPDPGYSRGWRQSQSA
jgi:hypothetical protein